MTVNALKEAVRQWKASSGERSIAGLVAGRRKLLQEKEFKQLWLDGSYERELEKKRQQLEDLELEILELELARATTEKRIAEIDIVLERNRKEIEYRKAQSDDTIEKLDRLMHTVVVNLEGIKRWK